MQLKLTESQQKLVETVTVKHKGKMWVVGGAIRDSLLGKVPKDIDFATDLLPTQIVEICKEIDHDTIPDHNAAEHGIIRIVDHVSKELIDVATLRRDVDCDGRHATVEFTSDIQEDLERRDFTINAMAAEIQPDGSTSDIVKHRRGDYEDGLWDIENKRVLFVGDPETRIKEDALRMIRACRFTALGDGWRIATSSKAAIIKHAKKIHTISKERIRDEILKALSYDKPSNFFRSLDACGLLATIMPDLAKGIGVEQNEHHVEVVFDHLLRCLDSSVSLTDNPLLRLAALLHDVAKPHTRSVGSDERVHFYKHEVVGATCTYDWMRTYKFPKRDCEYVSKLVRHHQWRFNPDSKDRTYRKWLQEVGRDCWRDLITLRSADRKGNLKKAHLPMVTRQMRDLVSKVEEILSSGAPIFQEDLAIDGNDLKQLGIPPSRIYKEIFANLLGIVLNDPSRNNKEWLLKYMKKHKGKYTNGRPPKKVSKH